MMGQSELLSKYVESGIATKQEDGSITITGDNVKKHIDKLVELTGTDTDKIRTDNWKNVHLVVDGKYQIELDVLDIIKMSNIIESNPDIKKAKLTEIIQDTGTKPIETWFKALSEYEKKNKTNDDKKDDDESETKKKNKKKKKSNTQKGDEDKSLPLVKGNVKIEVPHQGLISRNEEPFVWPEPMSLLHIYVIDDKFEVSSL